MAATRQTMTPVSMNQFAFSGATPIGAVAPAAGCDYAATNTTFTVWGSLPVASSLGIQYANNGSQWLWFYNGATPTTAYVLIGQKAGGIVQVYTQEPVTIAATSYGFLGPYSPAAFNQPDIAQFGGTGGGGAAPGGAIGATGQGLTCIDFLNTTTLSVRLYQTGTVTP
jgi:hypothetical protein